MPKQSILLSLQAALMGTLFLSGCGEPELTRDYQLRTMAENASTLNSEQKIVNNAPQADNYNFNINKDDKYFGQLYAYDVDGDEIMFFLTKKPNKGTLTLDTNGAFTYISDEIGADSFNFIVSDRVSQGVEKIVTIN